MCHTRQRDGIHVWQCRSEPSYFELALRAVLLFLALASLCVLRQKPCANSHSPSTTVCSLLLSVLGLCVVVRAVPALTL
jgi:hypothetical protein